jgi:5S rRNA maturation endonuclease (ribonuclease M5)
MDNRDIAEEINSHIERLKDHDILIIVEGKKDKEALKHFGITNVFSLDRWPLYKVVEHIAEKTKDCIILTDLDEEGKKLFSTINRGLSERGVRVDNRFREFLFRYTSLRQIEGLDTFYHNLHKTANSAAFKISKKR